MVFLPLSFSEWYCLCIQRVEERSMIYGTEAVGAGHVNESFSGGH